MKLISKNKIIISVVILFLLGFAGYILVSNYSKNIYTVNRGTIIQKVSETGRIISEKDFNLSFKTNGIVQNVYVKVGTKVKKGEILVELDKKELEIQLNKARAQRATVRARLTQLTAGATKEDINVYESNVVNAQTNVANSVISVENSKIALEDAKRNLINKMQDAFTSSDDAVRNRVDQFFSNPRSVNPKINFSTSESSLESDIEWQRTIIEATLTSWKLPLSQLTIESDFSAYIKTSKDNLNQIKSFVDKVSLVVNAAVSNSELSQTTIDAWKSDVAVARVNVNTSLGALSMAEEKMNNEQSALKVANGNLQVAKGALQKAKDELASIKAEPRSIDTAVLGSQVDVAQGAIDLLQKELNDTKLRAPSDGVITNVPIEQGERVAPNQVVVSLISESRFELEVYIPEESITKIKEGQPIEFTLDAFPLNDLLNGEVISIEPAATIIEEEVYYKVKGTIDNDIFGMREGMTADVDIIIGKKLNVLLVPVKAIREIDGNKTVLVSNGLFDKTKRIVKTGLSSGGFIEVTSGLKEGDVVIIE